MTAGADLGVVPYGTEALGVMRIEKGHVAGNELNGTTTAADLGLGKMLSKKKDFIGRVLAGRPGLTDPHRPALVGVRAADGRSRINAGAHFLTRGTTPTLENDQGFRHLRGLLANHEPLDRARFPGRRSHAPR